MADINQAFKPILKNTVVSHPVTGEKKEYKTPTFVPFPEKSKKNLNAEMEEKRHKFYCQCGNQADCPLGDW